MKDNIEVSDIVVRAGLLKGTVKLGCEVDVIVGYSGKGDKETLESILLANALEKVRQEFEDYYGQ